METIGKLLSLIFIAVVGAGGATMYILDSGDSSIKKAEPVPIEIELGEANPDLEKYREQLRKSYIESKPAVKKDLSEDSQDISLWSDSYSKNLPDYISEEYVADLASNSDANTLRENMNYWHNRYHQALKADKPELANDAYKKHKSYKYALEYKNKSFK